MKNHTDTGLVHIWPDFVDWEKRKKGNNSFIEEQLRRHGCKRVYDLCLGGGFDSIELLLGGFEVVSNEIDPDFVVLALENARQKHVELSLTSYDWRSLPKLPKFDGAIMLGNSLVYLHELEDRKKAIRNVYAFLREKGVFIIDHRNFEYIIAEKDKILQGNFRYSGKYLYCGTNVIAYPVKISETDVLFEYLDVRTGNKHHLHQYPMRETEMLNLLKLVGFSKIETFYDYNKTKPEHHDFVQHIAIK